MLRSQLVVCALFMCAFPLQAQESSPDFDILYRPAVIDHSEYQTIITKPKTAGTHPAVLLIAGLGCYSLDHLKPDDPYASLLYGLTRRGYLTMRVEKNSEGRIAKAPHVTARNPT